MSNTIRKFRGKQYRQGHEPANLELTRIRAAKKAVAVSRWEEEEIKEAIDRIQTALQEAASKEQEEMGYGKQ